MKLLHTKICLAMASMILASCSSSAIKNAEATRAPDSIHTFCKSYAKIQAQTESCEDNDLFLDAAEDCLIKFENYLKTSGVKIHTPDDARRFAREGDATEQFPHFTGSSENILDAYIKTGRQAILELKNYSEQLNYPEDADNEEEHGSDPEEYANSVDCYGETKKSLISVADDFQYYIEKLEYLKKYP